jgi:hypothetical protein
MELLPMLSNLAPFLILAFALVAGGRCLAIDAKGRRTALVVIDVVGILFSAWSLIMLIYAYNTYPIT